MKLYGLLIAAFVLILSLAQSYAASEEELQKYVDPYTDAIMNYCAKQWPADFVMEKHCRQEQVDAWLEIRKTYEKIDATNDRTALTALAICTLKWKLTAEGDKVLSGDKSKFHNWVMVNHCWKEQLNAARDMGK